MEEIVRSELKNILMREIRRLQQLNDDEDKLHSSEIHSNIMVMCDLANTIIKLECQ